MDPTANIFTLGHSNLELAAFCELLHRHSVALVVDVRSRPHSSWHPQFSQPEFEAALRDAGFGYLFLGTELGGRPDDPKAYTADGRVDYPARRKSDAFGAGLERVLAESRTQRLALVCAEEDPLDCHRFLMISPALVEAGAAPLHLRRDGRIETQQQAEDRLLEAQHFGDVASGSLFAADRAAALEDAYAKQAGKVGFRADPRAVEYW
jgi:uncharacterized protein (DUF488 family)